MSGNGNPADPIEVPLDVLDSLNESPDLAGDLATLVGLPDDLAAELASLVAEAEADEPREVALALPSAPVLCVSLQDSGDTGCCTLCGKKAPGWPEVPAGWDFTPALAAAELPAFLICPECLSPGQGE